MRETPTRWEWMSTILSENGPRKPNGDPHTTMILALAAVGRFMDRQGDGAFPTVTRISKITGLGQSTIRRDLVDAENDGWILRHPRGRSYSYTASFPESHTEDKPMQTTEKRQEVAVSDSQHRQEVAHSPAPEIPPGGSTAPGGSGINRQEVAVYIQQSTCTTEYRSTNGGFSPELELLKSAAEFGVNDPEWKVQNPKGNEVLKWWINLRGGDVPRGDIGFQSAIAKRLAERHSRGDLIRAMIGMGQTFPYSNGETWDLANLERRFSQAHGNFAQHPEVQRWKNRRELEEKIR